MTTEELELTSTTEENTIDAIEQVNEVQGASSEMKKLAGFDFWRTALKSAKYVVAPMVTDTYFNMPLLI